MIKVDNGETIINGDGSEVMADLLTIMVGIEEAFLEEGEDAALFWEDIFDILLTTQLPKHPKIDIGLFHEDVKRGLLNVLAQMAETANGEEKAESECLS